MSDMWNFGTCDNCNNDCNILEFDDNLKEEQCCVCYALSDRERCSLCQKRIEMVKK